MSKVIDTNRGPLLVSAVFARCIERGDSIVITGRVRDIAGHTHSLSQGFTFMTDSDGYDILRPLNAVVQRVVGGRAGGGGLG